MQLVSLLTWTGLRPACFGAEKAVLAVDVIVAVALPTRSASRPIQPDQDNDQAQVGLHASIS